MRFAELAEGGAGHIFRRTKAEKLFYTQGRGKGNLPKAAFIVNEPHSLRLGSLAATLAKRLELQLARYHSRCGKPDRRFSAMQK
jgi:hypothetical protein